MVRSCHAFVTGRHLLSLLHSDFVSDIPFFFFFFSIHQSLARVLSQQRNAGTLVVVDHSGSVVSNAVRNAVTAAGKFGGDITALVAGGDDAVSPCW